MQKQIQSINLQLINQRDFFGLRDFYSLVKMIYQTACDTGATPGPEEIALCVQV